MPVCALQIVSAAAFVRAHRISAACAADLSRKETDASRIKGFCPLPDQCLNSVPQFTADDRFMRTMDNIPFAFGSWLILLCFVRNAAVFPLHHIADIYLIDQHIRNRAVFPQGAHFAVWALIPQAMQPLIFGWIWYAAIVQHTRDGCFAVSLCKEAKHFADDRRGLLINDQVPFLVRVFLVPIKGKGSDVEPIYAPAC